MSGGAGEAEMKCQKCRYFYRTMVGAGGYNPSPYCHILEDAGKHPKPLTGECFVSREKLKRRREKDA